MAPTSLSQPAKRRRTARGQWKMKHANVTGPQSPQSLTSPRTPSKPANISPDHFFKNKPLPETDTLGSRPARLPAERFGPENSWRRGRQLFHALQKAGNNADKHTATASRRSPENRPCRPHVFRANALAWKPRLNRTKRGLHHRCCCSPTPTTLRPRTPRRRRRPPRGTASHPAIGQRSKH